MGDQDVVLDNQHDVYQNQVELKKGDLKEGERVRVSENIYVKSVERPLSHIATPYASFTAIIQAMEGKDDIGMIAVDTPPGKLKFISALPVIGRVINDLTGRMYVVTDMELAGVILNAEGTDIGDTQGKFGSFLDPNKKTSGKSRDHIGSLFTRRRIKSKTKDGKEEIRYPHDDLRREEHGLLMGKETINGLDQIQLPQLYSRVKQMVQAGLTSPIELNEATAQLIKHTAANLLFGGSPENITEGEVDSIRDLTEKVLVAGLLGFSIPGSGLKKSQKTAFKAINREINKRVKRLEEVGRENFDPKDISDELIFAHLSPEAIVKFGSKERAIEVTKSSVSTIAFALMDTTAKAIAQGIRLAALNPEAFERIKNESEQFVNLNDRYPTFNDMIDEDKLPEVKRFISAILTSTGATPGITRTATAPIRWEKEPGVIEILFPDASPSNPIQFYIDLWAGERKASGTHMSLSTDIEDFLPEGNVSLKDLTNRPAFGVIPNVMSKIKADCSGRNLAIDLLISTFVALGINAKGIKMIEPGELGSGGTANTVNSYVSFKN